ncbi:WD40 repeat-containing protein [Heterostelium album PN500]|uniref:Pre-mRNA-processing factor 19 n=1 Tax=Heterostelium pallidum (strain ATCC 26659 / Pp 5 / PN500) TaxID=670386 RepID=D3B725_HETP5|nr:WD40 repeat-containing protein [Heterostelium album PN500]EFA82568.1 WD40 repeat-containing protein [Heterostelium album PN500]|eukprot:XP_020434685.1 WD40 repeat-containing protein [Heterostelium album PN500]
MICSISGDVPQEPVVSIKTGNVYEKRLIEKYIDTNGREPTTGEPLSITDIVVISKQSMSGGGVGGAKPRTSNATSIPSMLQMFQNEWDALMLETFTLKQQFEQVRQELAHSLYQYDASCRVIARLIKERDQARNALANAKIKVDSNNSQDSMLIDDLSEQDIKRITEKTQELTQKRKKRSIPVDLPKAQEVEAMSVLLSTNVNNTAGSLGCLDYHANQTLVATGSNDGLATLYDVDKSAVVTTFKGHQKKVNRVLFHPTEQVVCSSGVDKTVRVWNHNGQQLHNIKKHAGDVCGLTMHPLGDYVVSASTDATWAMHNILTGQTLITVTPEDNGGYHCAQYHPDGQVVGLGTHDKKIAIVTVNSKKCEIVLAEHNQFVNSIAFSENGYHMASSDSNTVKIWDLRRTEKSIKTIDFTDGQIGNISWDPSGTYLAIAGSVISIYNHKGKREFDQVKTFSDSIVYTDIKWSTNSKYFLTTSDDSTLKMWGNQ